ncbi:hypothetical protein BDQ17DRAFT_1348671 [Cyathus striatus]|nr:hypothetical protein BDQ17DRAFT_1348671 [Cyathus striatus]
MPDTQESTGKPRQAAEKHHKSKDNESQIAKKETTVFASIFVKDDANHSVHVREMPTEDAIDAFVESAKVCINVLEDLSDIHPFIAVPVLAFKLVVSLDLKRRENNAKVLAVKTQMLSMMSALYQLRTVKDPDDIGRDGEPLRGRLQTLMEEMERSIKDCGSACDVYMKKSFLRKYLKAHLYEARLAAYASHFADLKSELSFAIGVHTTLGVDSANAKLDDQRMTLESMQSRLQEILVRLDTPREREVRSIIEDNRGATACIQNTQILNELVEKTGENSDGSSSVKEDVDITTIQESLFKELAEDIDTAFKQNFALSRETSGDKILAYFSGGHERIVDPQLRRIWKEMGWKSTVKARHFVLALRDFFMGETEEFKESEKVPNGSGKTQLLSPPLTGADETPEYKAIDDDGSAFINIKEVNDFALSRPERWTLLQWLAYWAAGWQSSISNYRTKIYRTLRKMFKLLQKARPDNQRILDIYLDSFTFFQLESLLRSTRTTTESGITVVPELAKLTEEFTLTEEKKLTENLESISYIIDSTATVSLLTGPGRIERYIYPLIYLLLQRHIKIIQLSRTHIFHLEEMAASSSSLIFVRQFENFAFGMILKFGPQEPFELLPPEPFEIIVQPDGGPNIVKGNWAGYCTWNDGDPHEGEDGTTTGKADGYMGSLEMSASLIPENEGSGYTVDFVMVYKDGYWIRCIGALDTAAGTIIGRWYTRRGVAETKPIPGSDTDDYRCGSFELSRTPADLARLRYRRNEFEENRAPIRYTVQRRLLTPNYVITQLKKGRRFKELVIKRLNFYKFTAEEKQELKEIENTFYYSIARFVHYRITYHLGVTCDLCGRKIQQSRLICIVCRANVNNSLDFCIECHSTATVPVYDAHTSSHSLLRGDRFLHDCNRTWALPVARRTSERLKAAFKSQAEMEKSQENHNDSAVTREKEETAASLFKCFYCENVISLPCWVCLECPGDVLVCDDCDRQNQYPKLPEKLVTTPPSLIHMMLRITDDTPVEMPDDEQFVRVEKKLAGVTSRVDEKLDRLQEMIQTRTKELEDRLLDHICILAGKPVPDLVEHDESKTIEEVADSPTYSDDHVQMVNDRLSALEVKVDEKFTYMQEQFSSLDSRFSTVENLLREILTSPQC